MNRERRTTLSGNCKSMNSEIAGKILSDVRGALDVADATANELNATSTAGQRQHRKNVCVSENGLTRDATPERRVERGHDANLLEHPQLLLVAHLQDPSHERVLPRIQFNASPSQHVRTGTRHDGQAHLRMFASSSLMRRVRLSRFFICCSCRRFKYRAITVLSGIENAMIATPTNAGHPRMSYSDTNASVICARW